MAFTSTCLALGRSSTASPSDSVPLASSSSVASSPVTPISELSTSTHLTSISSQNQSKGNSYVTYPSNHYPRRQFTPPPKSRFVPFFESIQRANNDDSSSFAASDPSPPSAPIGLPLFSPTISRPTPSNLSFAPRSSYVEPAPRSAPVPLGSAPSAPWASRGPSPASSLSFKIDSSPSYLDQISDVVRTLRHQLNVKAYALQTAEAELTRLAEAYSIVIKEKTKISDKYARVKQRVDALEIMLQADDHAFSTTTHDKSFFAYERAVFTQEADEMRQWNDYQAGQNDHREQRLKLWEDDLQVREAALKGRLMSMHTIEDQTDLLATPMPRELPKDGADLVPQETIFAVLARVPFISSEAYSPLSEFFASSQFDFVQWVRTNGLQLPQSVEVLVPLSWEARLALDEASLERLGVTSANDRSYIMHVLKVIANGEAPGLHPSLIGPQFTEDQYVAIMREQRIDKHVPNLAGIPWPRRLFLEEEDLIALQVQKAGARGTILTVFGGLRRCGPRPDPRPRRGTKKTRRAKAEAAAASEARAGEKEHVPEKRVAHGANGRPNSRFPAPANGKGAFAPGNSHQYNNNANHHHNAWFGNRV